MCTFFFFVAVVIESTVFIVCTVSSVDLWAPSLKSGLNCGSAVSSYAVHCPYKNV